MDYLERIPVPAKGTFNLGLSSPTNAYMLGLFGHPIAGGAYSAACADPDVPAFRSLLATRSVGPIRVTGLIPALDSLTNVFARVKHEVPDLYAMVGTAGMLCARFTKIRQPRRD